MMEFKDKDGNVTHTLMDEGLVSRIGTVSSGGVINREQVIKWAREAGFDTKHDMVWVHDWEITPTLARFAALVAAHYEQQLEDARTEAVALRATEQNLIAALEAEREACARVCDIEASVNVVNAPEAYQEGRSMGATACANRIRARSNT